MLTRVAPPDGTYRRNRTAGPSYRQQRYDEPSCRVLTTYGSIKSFARTNFCKYVTICRLSPLSVARQSGWDSHPDCRAAPERQKESLVSSRQALDGCKGNLATALGE